MAKKWTRNELLIALGVYCKLPFGKFHSRHPLIIHVAEKMGRSSSSLSMKLCNLASLDPVITESGRKGLEGASELDREIWSEFSDNTAEMLPQAEIALKSVMGSETRKPDIEPVSYEEQDYFAKVKVRKGQKLFRDAVLSAYENRCCITGLADSRFLIASHIRPWRKDPENRLNPRNGLCLSLLFDKAFDLGLITFSEDYRLILSSELQSHEDNSHIAEVFVPRKGQRILMPSKFSPDDSFLAWHRNSYFVGDNVI